MKFYYKDNLSLSLSLSHSLSTPKERERETEGRRRRRNRVSQPMTRSARRCGRTCTLYTPPLYTCITLLLQMPISFQYSAFTLNVPVLTILAFFFSITFRQKPFTFITIHTHTHTHTHPDVSSRERTTNAFTIFILFILRFRFKNVLLPYFESSISEISDKFRCLILYLFDYGNFHKSIVVEFIHKTKIFVL